MTDTSLTETPSNPRVGSDLFTHSGWLALRDEALSPRVVSELVTSEQSRVEFLRGAELLRLFGDRALPARRLVAPQLLVADVLAAGHRRNAVLLPRRSSKTTTLIADGLGRAEQRAGYRVAVLTATSGKAGRARFLRDVAPVVERSGVPSRIYRGMGAERIEFPSGGFVVWAHSVDDLRGEAFDLIIIDEAGEADAEQADDILAAALPTMDTRPGAQIVFAGTANLAGSLLHRALEDGRGGRGGIVEYAVHPDLDLEEVESWERARPFVLATHPGVAAGLTTLDAIEDNYAALTVERFAAEYLGRFVEFGQTVRLFDPQRWAETGVDGELPAPPERFSLAFACHPDGASTSIVAAWRDDEGRAVPMLLERIPGIDRAAPLLLRYARKYRVPISYDAGSQNAAIVVERLNRANPRPKLEPRNYPFVKSAASLVVDDVNRSNVVHYAAQADLTEAVLIAVKRRSGDRAWLLGRKDNADDITPAEAWALAQLAYDTSKPKVRARGRVAA